MKWEKKRKRERNLDHLQVDTEVSVGMEVGDVEISAGGRWWCGCDWSKTLTEWEKEETRGLRVDVPDYLDKGETTPSPVLPKRGRCRICCAVTHSWRCTRGQGWGCGNGQFCKWRMVISQGSFLKKIRSEGEHEVSLEICWDRERLGFQSSSLLKGKRRLLEKRGSVDDEGADNLGF